MPRVVHFEIHADDVIRAVRFYTDLFDWKITKWEGPVEYWLVTTGEIPEQGIDGAIMQRSGRKYDDMAVTGYVCTVQVHDIAFYTERALKLGAVEALPKEIIPGVGYQAYFKDTEGNVFGIHQPDAKAGK